MLIAKAVAVYHDIPEEANSHSRKISGPGQIDKSQLWAFFDGAAQPHGYRGGFLLYLSK